MDDFFPPKTCETPWIRIFFPPKRKRNILRLERDGITGKRGPSCQQKKGRAAPLCRPDVVLWNFSHFKTELLT